MCIQKLHYGFKFFLIIFGFFMEGKYKFYEFLIILIIKALNFLKQNFKWN